MWISGVRVETGVPWAHPGQDHAPSGLEHLDGSITRVTDYTATGVSEFRPDPQRQILCASTTAISAANAVWHQM